MIQVILHAGPNGPVSENSPRRSERAHYRRADHGLGRRRRSDSGGDRPRRRGVPVSPACAGRRRARRAAPKGRSVRRLPVHRLLRTDQPRTSACHEPRGRYLPCQALHGDVPQERLAGHGPDAPSGGGRMPPSMGNQGVGFLLHSAARFTRRRLLSGSRRHRGAGGHAGGVDHPGGTADAAGGDPPPPTRAADDPPGGRARAGRDECLDPARSPTLRQEGDRSTSRMSTITCCGSPIPSISIATCCRACWTPISRWFPTP